jgi:hypothetical protein
MKITSGIIKKTFDYYLFKKKWNYAKNLYHFLLFYYYAVLKQRKWIHAIRAKKNNWV